MAAFTMKIWQEVYNSRDTISNIPWLYHLGTVKKACKVRIRIAGIAATATEAN